MSGQKFNERFNEMLSESLGNNLVNIFFEKFSEKHCRSSMLGQKFNDKFSEKFGEHFGEKFSEKHCSSSSMSGQKFSDFFPLTKLHSVLAHCGSIFLTSLHCVVLWNDFLWPNSTVSLHSVVPSSVQPISQSENIIYELKWVHETKVRKLEIWDP